MLQNKPIRLKVSGRQDFFPAVCLLYVLTVVAALLSPHPILLIFLATVVFGISWVLPILGFSKSNQLKLTSVIFPDGRVQLECDRQDKIEGFLVGQQWCTRWLAIIRFTDEGKKRKLLIRAACQHNPDDFRRLHMWLRQGFYDSTRVKPVLDS